MGDYKCSVCGEPYDSQGRTIPASIVIEHVTREKCIEALRSRLAAAEARAGEAEKREPTQEEGDACEGKPDCATGKVWPRCECFAPGGWTGRRCEMCMTWVWGGPTRCEGCLEGMSRSEAIHFARVETETARTALAASRAEAERLRGALTYARQFIASVSEDCVYGAFLGGDPRDFSPDPECSTEEERAAHKAACEEYARNAVARDADCQPFASEDGKMVGWVTRCGFGLGVNTCRDERAEEVLAQIDASLAPATEGT